MFATAPSLKSVERHIVAKFDLVNSLVGSLADAPHVSPVAAELSAAIASLRVRYSLATCRLFFLESRGDSTRSAAREQFQRVVSSEGFITDLERILFQVCDLLGPPVRSFAVQARKSAARRRRTLPTRGPSRSSEVSRADSRAILQFFDHEVDCTSTSVECSATHSKDLTKCLECKVDMHVDPDASELQCGSCGITRALVGLVFDEAQFYGQEGQKAKSGTFNPNRHFQFWMEHILAREPLKEIGTEDNPLDVFGEQLVASMRAIIVRDRYLLRRLTIDDIRLILAELGRTDLNKNAAQILKKLTGVAPPSIPEAICQRVEKLFSRSVAIGETVRPAGRTNLNYYPYYIYKLLDAILPPDDVENRRIFYYIYMQKQNTLDKNDVEWRKICEELPEIEFRPTCRDMALAYRP